MLNYFNVPKLLKVTSSSFLLSLILLFSIPSASAVTLLTTIGNPVDTTTTPFGGTYNKYPSWAFNTAAGSGQTVSSIVFQMNAGNVNPDSIATDMTMEILSGTTVIDTFTHSSYDAGTKRVTLTGSAALTASTSYILKIRCLSCSSTTSFDQSNTNATGWQFTSNYFGTGYPIVSIDGAVTPDTTNPLLSSSTPVDNATGVAVSSNIVLTFDEAVDVETGNITIYKTSDGSTVETIDVTTGLVTGTGTTAITINPASDLAGSTEYYVVIAATAFDDPSGNSYAGISSTTALSFTTADIDSPSLSSSTPAPNVIGVAVDSNIVLTFDEAVDVETGNIIIKKTSDDSTVETIDVTSGLVTGTGTTEITVNPASDLAESTEYYVIIAATAFDDPSSNSYAGISSTTALSFTTVSTALPNPLEDKEVLELIQAQTDTVVRIAAQSLRPVNNRLSQLISAPRDSLANYSHQGIQLSVEDPTVNTILSKTGLTSGLNSSADIFDNGWAIWTEGSVVLGKSKGGTDFHIDGITAGVDKRITPLLTAGLALRVAQEDSDVGVASSIDTDSYSATAYGSYVLNENTYIQSALGYSDIDISSQRISNSDVFEGSRGASQVYMSLSLTRQFEYAGLTLLPYGSFDGNYSTLESYSESGSNLALTYHEQDIKALAATIGLRGKYFIEQSYGLFVPRFHVNYQGDISSDTDVSVNYVSIPSTTYSTSFDANSSSSWLFGLGIDYQYNNLNFSADYERTQEINWGYSDTFRLLLNATF